MLLPTLVAAALASGNEPADRLDLESVNTLFDRAILDHGGIDAVVDRLLATANDTGLPDRQRVDAGLTVAHMRWRFGQLHEALEATETALAVRESVDGVLLKGRLLDAAGKEQQATAWYEKSAEATGRVEEREFIRLRLTMAEASNRNIDAIVGLARQRDTDFRNRAAITLALLGHPEEAIALFEPSTALGDPFRQHVRLAHWAIEAGRLDLAQAEAWHAYRHATVRLDRLYALALLVESYRKDDALADLLARIEQAMSGDEPDPDLVQTRVDVLIETENYDEAIEFYEKADRSKVDVAARRRLIDLYEAAGRSEDLVVEYERLMATEPDVVHWYAGLAAHYLNNAQSDRALAVWQILAKRNPDREPVLIDAAEAMTQMGFVAEAAEMIENHLAASGDSRTALLFLFDLRLGRGENDQAIGLLKRIEATVADDPGGIRDLADAYERIGGPEDAIRILEALRQREGELGYDERLRLAWLYTVANRQVDALAIWQALWVSVDSAARRNLAESQFLLVATELNKLGDIVVDLEEKLIARQADRNEIGLLVRIYTEVGDNLSATEVIEEFARYGGTSEVERLRQLARVHVMLADYSAYDKVLRALVDADPDNRLEHIRNVVLNMLAFDLAEESQGRFGEIQRWLGRLRELDTEGVSGEFEAGIYAMGGFKDEAIDSYHRALVTHPDNSDNLLLMADLMKDAGRRDEAVALLQYEAEHADDDSAFVVAVDGIINMIGARSFTEQLTADMRKTFRWTQRIILERIAGHSGKFYLYQLFADVAREVGDTQSEFVALENSLSEAGVRRPAVLRELVTHATPNAGFAGYSTGAGEAGRQITHGRRLIGLKQALPPEVYINLGSALLDEDAVKDAERAFDLIDDITGMIDVDQTRADLLHEAGHLDEALAAYTRALNVNPDDLSLLTRTAMLREANGQDGIANRLYFRAIGNLLRSQPARRPAERPGGDDTQSVRAMLGIVEDTNVTRDYRTYFETLAQGFLVTWPDDPSVVAERLAATRSLVDDELASVRAIAPIDAAAASTGDGNATLDIAQFTRLERIAWFSRRVAARASDPSLRDHVDAALRDRFLEPDPARDGPEAGTPLLRRHLDIALASDEFETAVRLARVAGDEERLTELFRQRIDDGRYRDGLAYAHVLLGPIAFKRLVAVVAPTLKNNRSSFIELIEADPDLVLRIEADLGRELITSAELLDLLESPEAKAHIETHLVSGDGSWKYLKEKVPIDGQLRYFAAIAAWLKQGTFGSAGFQTMFHDLLAVELSPAQDEALLAAATESLGKHELGNEYVRHEILGILLDDHVIPENRHLVHEIGAFIQRRAQLAIDLPSTLNEILDGTDEESFNALVEWKRAGMWASLGGDRFAGIRARVLGIDRGAEVDTVSGAIAIGGRPVDVDTSRMVLDAEFPIAFDATPFDQWQRMADVLPNLIARYPDDYELLRRLVVANLALGETGKAAQALSSYYRLNPGDEYVRAALYLHHVSNEQYADALEVATDGGPDLREQTTIDVQLGRLQQRRGFRATESSEIFRRVYRGPDPLADGPWTAEVNRNIEILRGFAMGTNPLVEGETSGTVEEARRALRAVWRGMAAPSEERGALDRSFLMDQLLSLPLDPGFRERIGGVDHYTHDQLDQLLDPNRSDEPTTTLFEALANSSFGVEEFDAYLHAMPTDERRAQHRVYRFLIDAHEAGGTRHRRIEELYPRLGDLGDHDFTVWMLLRHRDEKPMTAREHGAFTIRAAEIHQPSPQQTLAMARLHAKAGAFDEASAHYRLLTAQLVRLREFEGRRGIIVADRGTPPIDLSALIAEIADVLPLDIRRSTVVSIIAAARYAGVHDAYTAYADAFLLKSLAHLHPVEDVLSESTRLSETGTDIDDPTGYWHRAKAVELARLHAMAGNPMKAIALLRAFVTADGSDANGPGTGIEGMHRLDAVGKLARLYGLDHLDSFYSATKPAAQDLILRRERLFPADPESRWPGDVRWMTQAAEALVSWLDDTDINEAGALEVAFTIVWQLNAGGEVEASTAVLEKIGAWIPTDEDRPGLRYLARMALKLDAAIPLALATEILAEGILGVGEEVQLLQALARHNDPAAVLAVGRVADGTGDRLALMGFLSPLARVAGDDAHAVDLERRFREAEEARRRLGLDL